MTKSIIAIVLACTGLLWSTFALASGASGASVHSGQSGGNIEAFLSPDGSLNLPQDFSGSLDPKGFQMTSGPDGAPRFVKADGSPKLFGAPGGCDGPISAIAVASSNLVYLGGSFSFCEDVQASNIVAYDPQSRRFQSLGSGAGNGVDGVGNFAIGGRGVYALALIGNDLYVGGNFSRAGGQVANHIARWNGSTWSALGADVKGTNGTVFAITSIGTDLYAGGSFTQAGGLGASRVARWNGSTWSALSSGNGVNGVSANGINGTADPVNALAVVGNQLFVGGNFDRAGGLPARGLARWNGSEWSALELPSNFNFCCRVGRMVVAGSDLYVSFGNGVGRWDGSAWHTLPILVDSMISTSVSIGAMTTFSNDLYVSVGFTGANGQSVNYIARWNGSSWSALGTGTVDGTNSPMSALAFAGNNLYAGGSFTQAGGQSANRIARWDGSGWSVLGTSAGNGVNGLVSALAVSGSNLYVSGDFTRAGNQPANRIASWNGSAWSALGSGASNGVNGLVHDLIVVGNDLYVGGEFTQAGGQLANRVARWNGSAWSALGTGVNRAVYALAVIGNDLYVGGVFSLAGGQPVTSIARWNGSAWSTLGSGLVADAPLFSPLAVYALAVNGTDLYVGGEFKQAGGFLANNIARWNGSAWSSLGSVVRGVNGRVSALAIIGSDLYAGGEFDQAGEQLARNIARWNGSTWSALGSGLLKTPSVDGIDCFFTVVCDFAVVGNDLYVGGRFGEAGSRPANGLARWNGNEWQGLALDSPQQWVSALAADTTSLYAADRGITQTPLPQLQSTAGSATGNGASRSIASSETGSTFAFASEAGNLTVGDTNNRSDVFLRNTLTGAITRASAAAESINGGLAEAFSSPSISANGERVAFVGSSGQVYALVGNQARVLSRSATGTMGNAPSTNVQLPGNGTLAVFESGASNLVTGDSNGVTDIYATDLTTGAVTLLSRAADGSPANGASSSPWASADGQSIAFSTLATNLAPTSGTTGQAAKNGTIQQVLIIRGQNRLVISRNPVTGALGNGHSTNIRLSADGRFGVFQSLASNLVEGDTNGVSDIFRFELNDSRTAVVRLERVSTSRFNLQANGPSRNPSLCDDDQFVAFDTDASNLIELDQNGVADILIKWMVTGDVLRLSRTVDNNQPNGSSVRPSLSGDCSTIVFDSAATNLTQNDNNNALDVFSVNLRGGRSNTAVNHTGTYWNPQESGHGLFVVQAGNTLVPAWYTYDTDGKPLWFLVSGATLQPDGSYSGSVFRYTGAPFNQTPANAVQTTNQVGTARLRFGSGGSVEFTYTINNQTQTRNLVKFDIAPTPLTCAPTSSPRSTATNYTDLWWNPAQQGWGLNLQHQGSSIFLAWYTFGPDQRPMWVSGLAQRQPNGSFTGTLNRPVTGTPWPQINGSPATAQPIPTVGNFSLNFSNGETATFTWTLDGITQTRSIRRFEFGSPATVCEG